MELITQQISYDDEQNSEESWRRYKAEFNNDVVVWIYCPQNIRPINLEIELIETGGTEDD